MAFTLFRFLRSTCVPTTVVVGFCFLLTFIFILYQPTHGPGPQQRLGWQAWDVITPSEGKSQAEIPPAGGSHTGNEGVDWWNVTQSDEDNVDYASLPLDVWAPLLPHDTGLSELQISRCIVEPALVDFCGPPSTVEKDAIKGKWVRVERNLNLQSGVWHLNLYYRRTRRQDVNLITDLQLLPEGVTPILDAPNDVWKKVDRSIRDGQPRADPAFLWYKLGKTFSEMSSEERQRDLITELDVIFGPNEPWYGFTRLEPPVATEQEGRLEQVSVTYRRGVHIPPRAPPLHFSHDGSFRILQVADLHYSVSRGKCRDTTVSPCSDNVTNTMLGRVLDVQKPSMVIFTGDQLNGQGTSWDPKSVLAKFARAVTERNIPWAAVFGNHDDEDGEGREEQLKMLQGLPYSLVERGPRDIHGVGNYVLKVKSADPSKTHLLTLYFLDSGSYSKGVWDFFGWFHPTDYDYIHENQIQWFLQESASIAQIERPFQPDTSADLGDVWRRQSDDQITPQQKRLAKPNALMFFHIPMHESFNRADRDPVTNKPLDVGIHGQEGNGTSSTNKGFFANGLLKAFESSHVAVQRIPEVKVVANGHNHKNCRRVQGIWLCFGGGGSYSGYGKIGFDRRFRIYDISQYGEIIRTYKYTDQDLIIDEMTLAGQGAPSL